jgi:hypothetical protein
MLILIILILVIGYIVNRIRTKHLREALGREVGDHELTSLNSWMEATAREDQLKKTKNL